MSLKNNLIFTCIVDIALSLVIVPVAILSFVFRKIGPHRLPVTRKLFKYFNVYPIINHYYDPQFKEFSKKRLDDKLSVKIKTDHKDIYQNLTSKYRIEFEALKKVTASDGRPMYIEKNGFYEYWDSLILYSIVREFRPCNVVEVGSGFSTRVLSAALHECYNVSNSRSTSHICIEPFEKPWLEKFTSITLMREKIENVDLKTFNHLDKNDLLFIDSSHILKSETDIHILFRDIFPELQSGVIIHIHDVFLPFDYPEDWTVFKGRFWNEQYILEILLQNTNRYEIIFPSYYYWHKFIKDSDLITGKKSSTGYPTSFFIKIK